MANDGDFVRALRQATEEAVALAAEQDRDISLLLTLRGVQVRVTGASPVSGQSYTSIELLRWDRLEQDPDAMGAIVEAVASGMATVTERLQPLR